MSARRLRLVISNVIVLIGVICSVWAFLFVNRLERSGIKAEFNQFSAERAGALGASVVGRMGLLDQLQNSYNILERHVGDNRAGLTVDIQRLLSDTLGDDSNIETILWAPRVSAATRPAWESRAWINGRRKVSITELDSQGRRRTAQPHSRYFPMVVVEPASQLERLVGLNLESDPLLAETMRRSAVAGVAQAVPPAPNVLQTTPDLPVTVILQPLFGSFQSGDSVATRLDNVAGYFVVILRVDNLFEDALSKLPPAGLDVLIYDTTSSARTISLHKHLSRTRRVDSTSLRDDSTPNAGWLEFKQRVFLAGRAFTIVCRPAPAFLTARRPWSPWVILAASLLLTAFFGLYLFTLLGHTSKVERAVSQRTSQLVAEATERKHAEDEARASEQRYRLLFEHNLAGVLATNLNGEILECNEALVRMLGNPSDTDLKKRKAENLYFDPAERGHFVDQVRAHGMVAGLECRFRKQDGSPLWIFTTAILLRRDSSSEPLIHGTIVDINDRKRAEEALAESRERLKGIFECAQEGIGYADLEGTIVDANDALVRLAGYPRSELIGLPCWKLARIDDARIHGGSPPAPGGDRRTHRTGEGPGQ